MRPWWIGRQSLARPFACLVVIGVVLGLVASSAGFAAAEEARPRVAVIDFEPQGILARGDPQSGRAVARALRERLDPATYEILNPEEMAAGLKAANLVVGDLWLDRELVYAFGRKTNIRFVLLGQVTKQGDGYRVRARLADCTQRVTSGEVEATVPSRQFAASALDGLVQVLGLKGVGAGAVGPAAQSPTQPVDLSDTASSTTTSNRAAEEAAIAAWKQYKAGAVRLSPAEENLLSALKSILIVEDESEPDVLKLSDIRVQIDGEDVKSAMTWGNQKVYYVEPGEHVLRLSAPGNHKTPVERTAWFHVGVSHRMVVNNPDRAEKVDDSFSYRVPGGRVYVYRFSLFGGPRYSVERTARLESRGLLAPHTLDAPPGVPLRWPDGFLSEECHQILAAAIDACRNTLAKHLPRVHYVRTPQDESMLYRGSGPKGLNYARDYAAVRDALEFLECLITEETVEMLYKVWQEHHPKTEGYLTRPLSRLRSMATLERDAAARARAAALVEKYRDVVFTQKPRRM